VFQIIRDHEEAAAAQLQAVVRGRSARQHVDKVKRERAATSIQSLHRQQQARSHAQQVRRQQQQQQSISATRIQCVYRSRNARNRDCNGTINTSICLSSASCVYIQRE